MRALVIDDSKPVRSILAKMLRDFGFETCEAANGQEGLESLRQLGKPDLATVNWQMPEMDGLQFIRAVRADGRYRDLPLVMVSGESEPSRVSTAIAAGADEYIVKPCTQKSLATALSRLKFSPSGSSASPTTSTPPRSKAEVRKIRVMIVDDSVIVRRVVTNLLSDDPELVVAGSAVDGKMALERLERIAPDIMLLDVEMPNLNGLETLKALRKIDPRLPVIMFSSLTERGAAVTTEALLCGANDYVAKPGGTQMRDAEAGRRSIRDELIPKIKQLVQKRVAIDEAGPLATKTPRAVRTASRVEVIVMAASTGGPCALAKILPSIVLDCPVPVLIVQHMPPIFTRYLAERLAGGGQFDVREAVDGDRLQRGQVRLAPGGFHLAIHGDVNGNRLQLNQDPPVNACRPSADVLFRSAAEVYGEHTLAVVLTGMGNDGLLGCKFVRQAGGQILVQDEASSTIWGMPGQVARAGLADGIFPLETLGNEIDRRVRRRGSPD